MRPVRLARFVVQHHQCRFFRQAMALNGASHNVPGEKTGPTTAHPPAPSAESKAAILDAANGDAVGQSAPGRDGGDSNGEAKGKSEEKLRKEKEKAAKAAEKQAKFEAKKAKAQEKVAGSGKAKEKKKDTQPAVSSKDYVELTPPGEKKILQPLDDDFHKAYHPKVVESAWNEWWEKCGFFKPEFKADGSVKDKGSFVIAIPPPNVTGALHCGHALATTLQDTLIRFYRMKGYTTLYIPGCDHAGIATQSVVEKMLWRREKKVRHDLGRKAFIERTQEWKEDYHQRINKVFRRMGGSMDWSREAFTMSPELSRAVTETFVQLHDEGLIYRSNRLVNWCTKLNTALSNLEVDQKELEGRTLLDVPGHERKVEFGVLTHFKYQIEGTDATIEIATTRPETMLGDSGIAVHPEDERYKQYLGKNAIHPFIPGRKMPIVPDTYVDREFGTGAVKITPAHDPNDFAIGTRHNLQFINILNDDGTMNENTGDFQGQKRFEARYSVINALKEKGLYVKWENNPMKVPICSRSGDIVEPLMKPQWWMAMDEMSKIAYDSVKNGDIKISPASAEKSWYSWLSKPQDWCLSRQLWWGHQIPAYLVKIEGDNDPTEKWVVGRSEEEAQKRAEAKYSGKKFTLTRDEDVLDTWFSSGLWPFSTLGWPEKTPDFEKLFPTSVLETGWDILFFWVARMVMMSLKLTGKVPFHEVYCHSLIRDSEGRKMSKSLGNVIDPVDILEGITLDKLHAKLLEGNLDPKEVKNAERYQKSAFPQGIPECGADALRFSLVQYTTGGGDINFDVKTMAGYRRFCNKIYQATKFVLGKLAEQSPPATAKPTGRESLAERWILHHLTHAARDINNALETREFSHSTQVAHRYFLEHLCDVYIENSKSIIADGTPEEQASAVGTLYTALEGGLRLMHPFMPFLTEELWQRLPRRPGDETPSIMLSAFPEFDPALDFEADAAAYDLVLGCSRGIRSLLATSGIKEGGVALIQPLNAETHATASAQTAAIKTLSGRALAELEVLPAGAPAPSGCLVAPVGAQAASWLRVEGLIDVAKELPRAAERLRDAGKALTEQRAALTRMEEAAVSGVVSSAALEKARDEAEDARVSEDALAKQLQELQLMEKRASDDAA